MLSISASKLIVSWFTLFFHRSFLMRIQNDNFEDQYLHLILKFKACEYHSHKQHFLKSYGSLMRWFWFILTESNFQLQEKKSFKSNSRNDFQIFHFTYAWLKLQLRNHWPQYFNPKGQFQFPHLILETSSWS